MAFNFTVGVNHSENNKISKDVTMALTLTGTLRGECSIVDPIIEVSGSIEDYSGYNYIEIPSFRRKYFIRNITTIRTGLVSIECHCDVLSSFASAILDNYGIAKKSTNAWNLYLNDGTLKVNQYADYKTYYFPNGFTTQEFILAVAGG